MTNKKEIAELSDYGVGTLYVVVSTAFAILLGWFYWISHGGSIDSFAFWTSGDKKWLEVLFWSFFTALAWNITDTAVAMCRGEFQKRTVWYYIGRSLEVPPISFALVIVVTNLGVAFGDATVSLVDAPILVIIAFAIIAAYFSQDAVDALQTVAKYLTKLVKEKLPGDSTPPVAVEPNLPPDMPPPE